MTELTKIVENNEALAATEAKGKAKRDRSDRDPRKDLWFLETDDIFIPTDPTHELYDARWTELPVREDYVVAMLTIGFLSHKACLVRRDRKAGNQKVMVDGKQRFKALLEANGRIAKAVAEGEPNRYPVGSAPLRMPAIYVDEGTTTTEAFALMLASNLEAEPESTLGMAHKMCELIKRGMEESRVAAVAGVDVRTLRRWKKLDGLHPKVKKLVATGKLASKTAADLADLDPEKQLEECEKAMAAGEDGEVDGKQLERNTKARKAGKEASEVSDVPGTKDKRRQLRIMMQNPAPSAYEKGVMDALSWTLDGWPVNGKGPKKSPEWDKLLGWTDNAEKMEQKLAEDAAKKGR